jgi:hypothetical protein
MSSLCRNDVNSESGYVVFDLPTAIPAAIALPSEGRDDGQKAPQDP